ncbi:LysE family transporter [Flavobacterium sp. F-328]|jgi:threonine/homoserine/homoserine lactone efflux protein|uniref:LysE family transporter n=2 Tax=Flavobacterium TaxID=237 RepID=A0ABR7JH87_9FLAO|nr:MULTISPECIES: LysE family transporter [Flavobacterium]MBC5863864.1 LysE family transporter [Flavobacterium turcicum]MBQ0909122.1 LysE family transporter [Flavobacterium erciyesense]NHL02188.1 LysE family transporter [Flavobacterium turcicum]
MNLITSLFLGFITAFVGITPPGLINMTAAKVNLKEGKSSAYWFVLGAVIIIFFQASLAIFFARFIKERPDVVVLLREVGFGIFAVLTVYFLFIAKKPVKKMGSIKKRSTSTRFFLGMLLSALNFFPIPYYVFVSITLASYNLFYFEATHVFTFVAGVVSGSFLVFYFYITFFQKIQNKTDFLMRNMNGIIGTITGLIALFTLVNIVRYYFG